MKEIAYDGPAFDQEENDWRKKSKERSKGSVKAPTMRTFRADVEEMIEEKAPTKTQVIMAEANRRESRGESRVLHEEESHLGRIIFILVLVLAFGTGIAMYALVGTKMLDTTPTTPELPLSMKPLEITLTNSPREQVMADLSIAFAKTSLATGGIREVKFLIVDASGSRSASTSELLRAISASPPPDGLLRSLGDESEYGIHALTSLTGYFYFRSRSYPNTFAGMLEWETNIARDLIPPFNPLYARKNILNLTGRAFKDERIGGRDSRILRDIDGKALIAYTFIDKKYLLITSTDLALASLLTIKSAE